MTAGGNYGWPGAEGNCSSCTSINPIYTYAHGGNGAAFTSVLVYNGGALGPDYQNKVFIADEVKGWIKVLTCNARVHFMRQRAGLRSASRLRRSYWPRGPTATSTS